MKILFAAFDPFGGEKINPAWEAVSRLPDEICGAAIIKIQIPTIFGEDGRILEDAIRKNQPDAVICVGQAGGRPHVSVEQVLDMNEEKPSMSLPMMEKALEAAVWAIVDSV